LNPQTTQARQDVEALATHAGREVGSPAHDDARRWLVDRLSGMNLAPYAGESFELPYTMGGTDFCNVMARLPGRRGASSGLPILLAAHYDTCGPYPGADDNAAAIAAALLAAESLSADPIDADVVLAFFDAEEPPHFLAPSMGSTFFYDHQRQEDFRCAVVMDLVGHDIELAGLEDSLFLMGAENLVEKGPEGLVRPLIEDLPEEDRLDVRRLRNDYVGDMSDHHIFRENGAPFLFLSCGEWTHYHMPTDTPDRLNYERIAVTGDYLVKLARWLDQREVAFDPTSLGETDEARIFTEDFGSVLEKFGLEVPVRSSAQVAEIVHLLRSSFLGG